MFNENIKIIAFNINQNNLFHVTKSFPNRITLLKTNIGASRSLFTKSQSSVNAVSFAKSNYTGVDLARCRVFR